MKVVVTTPAGNVGSRVVRLLIQAGVRPTLLARHPARLDPATRECADVVEADLADAATVVRATRNADALFWVNPPTTDPDADPIAWYAGLGANAARAVTENQIGRVVFLSSIGAELRTGAGEIDGLSRTEEQLDATGAAVLHLRCGYFFTNLDLDSLHERVVKAPMALNYAQPWVDPRDIGDIAAVRLLCADWSGRQVQAVHGPEDLTLARAADIISEATGHRIRAETISEEAWRSSLRSAGFGPRQVEGMVGMSAVTRDGFVPEDKRSIVTTTPTTLAAWAHAYLRPVLASTSRWGRCLRCRRLALASSFHGCFISVTWRRVTEATIRQATDADQPALAQLRRESAFEQDGEQLDPDFEERFGAWFTCESSRRITWLAKSMGAWSAR